MSSSGELPAAHEAAMRTLKIDRTTAVVVGALRTIGVEPIVLKGRSIAEWLYEDSSRQYVDCDLLVRPEELPPARRVLRELGFAPDARTSKSDRPSHAVNWTRGDGADVDLHRTLVGARCSPAEVWQVLARHRTSMNIAGVDVHVLDEPARLLHLALHLAQDRLQAHKKRSELRRAVDQVPFDVWLEARRIGGELDALEAMAAGLRAIPAGEGLAEHLDLPGASDVSVILRDGGAPPGSLAFGWWIESPGFVSKTRLALRKAFPPPAFIRAWWPPSRRVGALGLAMGYVVRVTWLLFRLPAAAVAWFRARAISRKSPGPSQ